VREQLTSWLDVLGLLLLAAGAGAGAGRYIGWAGLAVSGAVVLVGSVVAARRGGGSG
jgi:hypothetical protein